MAVIYVTLITKEKKFFWKLPEGIKPRVKKLLIDLELPELIIEEEPDGFVYPPED